MPLKKPFTCPLSFQSSQAEIDFLIQLPSPSSHSNLGSFPQPDYMEVLSVSVDFLVFGGGGSATSIKK